MKKTHLAIVAILISILFSQNINAQAFDDGTNLLFLGFGIPPSERIKNDFNKGYRNYIDYKFKNYGTGVLKFEHGLHKYFGLGLNLEYSGASVTYKYDDENTLRFQRTIKSNVFGFYGRINGHYPIMEKLDVFAGVGLGYLYTINKYSDTNPSPTNTTQQRQTILDFDYQFTGGVRFMVKDNIGMFLEVGWATTPAQVGIVMKF